MAIANRSQQPAACSHVWPRLALATIALLWPLARLRRVRVQGASMVPTLVPGDRLLVLCRGGPWRRPRPGDLVVVRDPRAPRRTLVKRFGRRQAGGVLLLGDNPSGSTDSRTFGTVAEHELAGRAVYRYAPPARVGRL